MVANNPHMTENNVIVVRNLSKVYGGKIKAVNKISFFIKRGEIFGFLGPNGAGKTTTIKMLTTLIAPTSGDARILGYSIKGDSSMVRASIGVVPQEFTADEDLTGFDNALLIADLYGIPRAIAKKRISDLMELVELNGVMNRKVSTYSGGMRRRLELAIGLVNHPKILFLDEPTLGLDVQTRAAVWRYIQKLKKDYNMTLFMTTHYLEEADSLCDRIAIIDRGRIIRIGSPNKLKAGIGGDIVSLSVNNDHEDLTDMLRKINGVVEVKRVGKDYRIKVKLAETLAPKLITAISAKGYQVTKLSMTKPTLDEAYLEYTGRSLREEETSTGDVMSQRRTLRLSRS
jgi:ABC-2 type transport system ATP-binding protein